MHVAPSLCMIFLNLFAEFLVFLKTDEVNFRAAREMRQGPAGGVLWVHWLLLPPLPGKWRGVHCIAGSHLVSKLFHKLNVKNKRRAFCFSLMLGARALQIECQVGYQWLVNSTIAPAMKKML
jgi:hypothetical protein